MIPQLHDHGHAPNPVARTSANIDSGVLNQEMRLICFGALPCGTCSSNRSCCSSFISMRTLFSTFSGWLQPSPSRVDGNFTHRFGNTARKWSGPLQMQLDVKKLQTRIRKKKDVCQSMNDCEMLREASDRCSDRTAARTTRWLRGPVRYGGPMPLRLPQKRTSQRHPLTPEQRRRATQNSFPRCPQSSADHTIRIAPSTQCRPRRSYAPNGGQVRPGNSVSHDLKTISSFSPEACAPREQQHRGSAAPHQHAADRARLRPGRIAKVTRMSRWSKSVVSGQLPVIVVG